MRTRIFSQCQYQWLIAGVVAVAASCSNQDPKDYVSKQAAEADKDKPSGAAIRVETPVPGGTRIPCDELFDVSELAVLMQQPDGVSITDQSKGEREATAVCSVRKGGEAPDDKAQAKMSDKTLKLGVIAGDEICNVAVYCSLPPDPDVIKTQCEKQDNTRTSNALGVYACVEVVAQGSDDSYTYKFIDPDSKCTMRVRAGPSVADEGVTQTCARAAMEQLTPDRLKADD